MTVSTFSLVNQAVSTIPLGIWQLITAMKAAGWTQQGSGDGSTFSNSGAGPVANGGTAATGLDRTTAWVRLRDPSGLREVIFRRNNATANLDIYLSIAARFTGGSPSATVAPTATDQVTLISTSLSTAVSMYAHCIVEDTAINGVWGFWCIFTTASTSARLNFFALDPFASGALNSRYSVLGSLVEPYVWLNGTANANPSFSLTSYNTPANAAVLYIASPQSGTPSTIPATMVSYDASGGNLAGSSQGGTLAAGLPVSPWDGGDDIMACIYGRFVAATSGSPGGMLGISHHMSLKGIPARNYPDSVQHASSDLAWVYYSTYAIPWPKGTTPSA